MHQSLLARTVEVNETRLRKTVALVVLVLSFFSYSADRPEEGSAAGNQNQPANNTENNGLQPEEGAEAIAPVDTAPDEQYPFDWRNLLDDLNDLDKTELFGDESSSSSQPVNTEPEKEPAPPNCDPAENQNPNILSSPNSDQVQPQNFTNPSSHPQDTATFDCVICLSAVPLNDIADLNCSCMICNECLQGYIEHADRYTLTHAGLPCPSDQNCSQIVQLNLIRQLAGEQHYERITGIISSIISSPANFIQCPIKSCQAIMCIDEGSTQTKANCVKCKASICARCKVSPYHESITCDDFQQRQNNPEISELPDTVFRCPNCKAYIELVAGCNLVTCPGCRKYVCAECKKSIPEGYKHFKPGGCKRMNPELTQTYLENLPLNFLQPPPYFGTLPNAVEQQWLRKHLKYRPNRDLNAFMGGKCNQCNMQSNAWTTVRWDCGHRYCYLCGSNMFNNHTEWDQFTTHRCIKCLQQSTTGIQSSEHRGGAHREQYTQPTRCILCNTNPRASNLDLYCNECINIVAPEPEGAMAADPAVPAQIEAQQNPQQFHCELCNRAIHQDNNYCTECSLIIERSMKTH